MLCDVLVTHPGNAAQAEKVGVDEKTLLQYRTAFMSSGAN